MAVGEYECKGVWAEILYPLPPHPSPPHAPTPLLSSYRNKSFFRVYSQTSGEKRQVPKQGFYIWNLKSGITLKEVRHER